MLRGTLTYLHCEAMTWQYWQITALRQAHDYDILQNAIFAVS